MTATTKLEAVNTLLAGIGEQPVSSLEASESTLVDQALRALNEASKSIQTKEWYWNTENGYPLSPNADGNIVLPQNTVRVSEVRASGGEDCVERGRKLYSRTRHSSVFPQGSSVEVDLVLELDWEELPEFARQPIMFLAQKRFQMRELTSTAIDRVIEADFVEAITTLEHAEDAQGPANTFSSGGAGLSSGQARRRNS